MFPPSMLANVYVKGSLKNTEDGFEFALKNNIESTMLSGVGPIVVGGQSYSGAAITLTVGDRVWQADQIGWRNLVPASVGVSINVRVQGAPLPSGPVKLSLTAASADIGSLTFEVTDTI
ncbi:MAG: hypothetical protein BWY52_02323 [Chloroflexi bacterium ADurb.Bin325]|nr:MAG: hypothetical protein BWY52_02323 [Chloroflexi bacterium ADurb.Bin325]